MSAAKLDQEESFPNSASMSSSIEDILMQNEEGDTILHFNADRTQYYERMKSLPLETLIVLVGKVNNDLKTPLVAHLEHCEPLPETIDLFFAANADFNFLDRKGYPVLAVAIENGRSEATLRKLIACGADLLKQNAHGNTILHLPFTPERYYEVIKMIPLDTLKKIVPIRNNSRKVALVAHVAQSEPVPGTIERFKEAKANFNYVNMKQKIYPVLHAAVKNGRGAQTLRTLIKCGADPQWKKGWKKKTLLHYAAVAGNVEAAKCLVSEFHLDVNLRTWSNYGPVHLADWRWGKDSEISEVLRQLGAK